MGRLHRNNPPARPGHGERILNIRQRRQLHLIFELGAYRLQQVTGADTSSDFSHCGGHTGGCDEGVQLLFNGLFFGAVHNIADDRARREIPAVQRVPRHCCPRFGVC